MALREFKLFFSIDVLDVTIEDKLTFNLHTYRICKSISNQLNSLKRQTFFWISGMKDFNKQFCHIKF